MSTWLRVRAPFDRLLALAVAVPAAPVALVLGWLIHRADGGPGIARVARVGRAGRPFAMWKLRTMTATSPTGRAEGAPITATADDRITPLGRRLRAVRIDELPQLVHVISGRMAMLGPRPEAPELVQLRDPAWHAVLRARPAIAGPTQLLVADWEAEVLTELDPVRRYRDSVLPVKLAIDGWYVRHATPWIDLLVIVSLFQRLVGRRVPTVIERRVRREVPEAAVIRRPHLKAAAA
jgi:lipopolysaccharide/colanic/teichoic acid biosynthesis glycosyltransferase